ncbi:hypothetical protein [Schaalia canis]|uniref:putative acetyltransferase n=1 Tax=Schaalia canis TaxID=100469 RepID=UPI001F0C866D|nr:hypothetical protein [Schaalia canis]
MSEKVGVGEPQLNTPPASPPPPRLPWLEWKPGDRVVLRYRLEDGLHDALGDVIESTVDHVTINTRRGPVRVEAPTMVTGKKVPPPPAFPVK